MTGTKLGIPRSVQLALLLCLVWPAAGQNSPSDAVRAPEEGDVILPRPVPDPLEPFNRAMWSFNRGLLADVVKPTSRAYRFIVRKPVRRSIGNFGRNLTYPGRLINNLLEGKWRGAGDESRRFLCNTTLGVAGLFDVAERRGIPRSDADFGLTFGQWGWQPGCYLMLPVLGPSNERDALGFACDAAASPLLYISPYDFVASNPLSWLGPYTYFSYAVMYNDLSDSVRESVRFARAEMDPYSVIHFASTFQRQNRVVELRPEGGPDKASLETLKSVFSTYKDPGFPDRGLTRSVRIPATGRKLKFTTWLQPGRAPMVYLLPGLGSHRLSQHSLALAEMVHGNGYSVVSMSSTFHSEFMDSASTAMLPANLPVDGHDVHVALTEIDRVLTGWYPGRLGERGLVGFSMGGMHALLVAAANATNRSALMTFDRYVAFDTPVRLLHGVAKLDEFYRAPLAWPEAERTANIENIFLKVAALAKAGLTPEIPLPFGAVESKFLIGLAFRFTLRDIIFSSQRRGNLGVLEQPVRNLRRAPVYEEIMGYSYQDYFEKFAVPYYQSRGLAAPVAESLARAGDLRTYEAGLRDNPGIRLIVNRNDFLLEDDDVAWLQATFAPDQLTMLEEGGHLGNLFDPAIQKLILTALGGPVTHAARGE